MLPHVLGQGPVEGALYDGVDKTAGKREHEKSGDYYREPIAARILEAPKEREKRGTANSHDNRPNESAIGATASGLDRWC